MVEGIDAIAVEQRRVAREMDERGNQDDRSASPIALTSGIQHWCESVESVDGEVFVWAEGLACSVLRGLTKLNSSASAQIRGEGMQQEARGLFPDIGLSLLHEIEAGLGDGQAVGGLRATLAAQPSVSADAVGIETSVNNPRC